MSLLAYAKNNYFLYFEKGQLIRHEVTEMDMHPKNIVIFDARFLTGKPDDKKLNESSFGVYADNGDGTLSWRASDPTEYPEFILALTLEGYI